MHPPEPGEGENDSLGARGIEEQGDSSLTCLASPAEASGSQAS